MKISDLFLPKAWWKLSLRWLFGNKTNQNKVLGSSQLAGAAIWIAILSFVLGISSLSFVRALVTGFESQLSLGVADFFSPISYKSGWRSEYEHSQFVKAVQNADPKIRIESYWQGQALVIGAKTGRGVLVEGRKNWNNKAQACAADSLTEVTFGKALANYLGLKKGDKFKLLLPGLLKGPIQAKVQDLKSFGLQEIDSRRIQIDHNTMTCFLDKNSHLLGSSTRPGDFIGLRMYPPIDPLNDQDLKAYALKISSFATQSLRDSKPEIRTWKDQKQNFFKGLGFDRAVLSVVLGLLTLAASLNVVAALFVLFFERDREMLTLRALGMSPRQMLGWVLIQGLMIGIGGITLGFAGSYIMACLIEKTHFISLPAEVYNLDHLVFVFEGSDQVGVLIYGLIVALFVSSLVGILLSRMKIMEVLSHRR